MVFENATEIPKQSNSYLNSTIAKFTGPFKCKHYATGILVYSP